ncbi:hypothetical protein FHS27_005271 [Rhodopirellula rubra]|uniref:Uncharacterized protein n=1 Tax=Aporhodopirellula rubra TaxID=980271 RepID=A0A7W5E3A8_9BACT|nr:hypothetical protein [Aporhodopirellula rubra]MBB3209431.1 hypothetical protein [Aporhodopirellula rubra]
MKVRAAIDRRRRLGKTPAAVPVSHGGAAANRRVLASAEAKRLRVSGPNMVGLNIAALMLTVVLAGTLPLSAQQSTAYARPTEGTSEAPMKPERGRSSESSVTAAGGVIEHIGPAGLKTYRWDFSRSGDSNFDRWPDLFTRHVETGYPEYVRIMITPRDEALESNVLALDTALLLRWPQVRRALKWVPQSELLPPLPPSLADFLVDRCLTIRLDGGQARVTSPSLPTSRRYQYRFSVDVLTKNLTHDSVYAQVIFYDDEGNELQRTSTPAVTRTTRWRSLVIEALTPPRGARQMRVSLNVMGGEDGLQDIRGVVSFDNITFRQFPQMKVSTDQPFGVYRSGERVTATTQLMGLPSEPTRVRLRLLDHNEKELKSASRELAVADFNRPSDEERADESKIDSGKIVLSSNPDARGADQDSLWFDWGLSDLEAGFYIIDAAMENERGASLSNRSTFVIVDRLTDDPREWSPPASNDQGRADQQSVMSVFANQETEIEPLPYGWTMPPDLISRFRNKQVSGKVVSQWLSNVGVGWAKLPVWFSPEDTASADTAATLASRLRDVGINPVGLLDRPKEEQLNLYRVRERGDARVAGFLNDAGIWRPQLDAIMNRMTFRIRMWQLGDDTDFSFQELPDLSEKISEIADGLQGFGQPLEIMVPWAWLDHSPEIIGDSWKGVVRHLEQPLTSNELDAMLDLEEAANSAAGYPVTQTSSTGFGQSTGGGLPGLPKSGGRRKKGDTWLTIDPLPAKKYDRDSRITDLVLRMATVRGHKVEAAFVRRPLAPEATLVKSDWHPDDLLLPWRTTSLLLGRARNIGSLRMRGGSQNIVFRSSHSSVILIWSDTPRTERLFLGDNVYQVDVWGRRMELETEKIDGQVIHRVDVDRVPKFLVGIDPALAEFRMSVDIDKKRIDALLGREQPIGVQYKNPIGQSLVGTISIDPPPAWSIQPREREWDLNPFEKGQTDFSIILGNNATIGRFELPIAIKFATSPPTTIRVYRQLEVGPEGFDLVVSTRMVGDRLRVKIEMTNQTRRTANFDCLLFAGSDRQYERRVLAVGPGETAERNIDWTDGKNLIGQRLLLRAIEQEGNRVINYTFEVTR